MPIDTDMISLPFAALTHTLSLFLFQMNEFMSQYFTSRHILPEVAGSGFLRPLGLKAQRNGKLRVPAPILGEPSAPELSCVLEDDRNPRGPRLRGSAGI